MRARTTTPRACGASWTDVAPSDRRDHFAELRLLDSLVRVVRGVPVLDGRLRLGCGLGLGLGRNDGDSHRLSDLGEELSVEVHDVGRPLLGLGDRASSGANSNGGAGGSSSSARSSASRCTTSAVGSSASATGASSGASNGGAGGSSSSKTSNAPNVSSDSSPAPGIAVRRELDHLVGCSLVSVSGRLGLDPVRLGVSLPSLGLRLRHRGRHVEPANSLLDHRRRLLVDDLVCCSIVGLRGRFAFDPVRLGVSLPSLGLRLRHDGRRVEPGVDSLLDLRRRLLVNDGDRRVDLLGPGDGEAQRHLQFEPQLVRVEDVRGIGDDYLQRSVLEVADRKRRAAAGNVLAQQAGGQPIDVHVRQLDERELVLLGDEPGDRGRRDGSAIDEDLAEASAGREPLLRESGLQVRIGEQASRTRRAPSGGQRCATVRCDPRNCCSVAGASGAASLPGSGTTTPCSAGSSVAHIAGRRLRYTCSIAAAIASGPTTAKLGTPPRSCGARPRTARWPGPRWRGGRTCPGAR